MYDFFFHVHNLNQIQLNHKNLLKQNDSALQSIRILVPECARKLVTWVWSGQVLASTRKVPAHIYFSKMLRISNAHSYTYKEDKTKSFK